MTRIISIDGNIGSGKSTLVEKMKEYYTDTQSDSTINMKICFLQEPVDIWDTITDKEGKTILEHFYSNQEKYSFAFQMMAYISRLATIKTALKKRYDIIFTERSIFTDCNVFAKMLYDDGKMSEIEYTIYNKWFDEFINDLPEVEYIYLKTDPEIAFNRIIKRGRIGENIPLEYLTKCHEYHENWLDEHSSKCVINCNADIEESPEIISEWLKTIDKYITQNTITQNNESCTTQNTITFDGATRGNPGLCGAGFVIWNNDIKIFTGSEFISKNNTNDFAEYYALLIALKKCNELKIQNIIIKGDSELVIKQLNKEYNIQETNLLPLYNSVLHELNNFQSFKFIHIPCEKNKDADFAANKAITEYIICHAPRQSLYC